MFSIIYFIPAFIIPPLYFALKNKQYRDDIIIGIAASLTFFLLVLRSETLGNDIPAYKAIFDEIKNLDFLAAIKTNYMEPGYLILNWFIAKVTGSFRVLLIVQALLCLSADVFLVKKYSSFPAFSMLIILCIGMVDFPVDIIRQSMATAILLFSLPQIEKKRPLLFLLFVLLASSFHYTSLLFLVVFPASLIPLNRKTIIAVTVISLSLLFITPFLFHTVGEKIMALFNKSYTLQEMEMREVTFIILGIIAFILITVDFSSEIPRTESFIMWPFLLSLPLIIISFYVYIISRVAMFMFFPFVGIVLPNMLKYNRFEKMTKWFELGICMCFMAYYVFRMYGSYLVPYIPLWN